MLFARQSVLWFVLMFSWCSSFFFQDERLASRKCKEYQTRAMMAKQINVLTMYSDPIEITYSNCSNVDQLIVGGEPAKEGEFPHHALLGYPKNGDKLDFEFICGGTLISRQHVLTAAHCFAFRLPAVVRLNEYDTSVRSDRELTVDIVAYRKHPNYTVKYSYCDIALAKLKEPVDVSMFVRPACLWETEQRTTTRFIATGFGRTQSQGSDLSTVMMKVQLEEFPAEDCKRIVEGNRHWPTDMHDEDLCVGSATEGHDTCEGDSGGPLQIVTNPRTCTYSVVAITTAGSRACGISPSKAIYTKVSYYIDWIEDNVWGATAL
uniref:Peptidase S1 domain-containing protein n=1 Tax=Anopheles farauti TaxID=69004 RepID=A0A182Q7C5_9DIPT